MTNHEKEFRNFLCTAGCRAQLGVSTQVGWPRRTTPSQNSASRNFVRAAHLTQFFGVHKGTQFGFLEAQNLMQQADQVATRAVSTGLRQLEVQIQATQNDGCKHTCYFAAQASQNDCKSKTTQCLQADDKSMHNASMTTDALIPRHICHACGRVIICTVLQPPEEQFTCSVSCPKFQ
jgi:uncharacterized membrane protein